jgi:hypothetical protein
MGGASFLRQWAVRLQTLLAALPSKLIRMVDVKKHARIDPSGIRDNELKTLKISKNGVKTYADRGTTSTSIYE